MDLPWNVPLEEWPENIVTKLPRGISRHIVRFVRLENQIIAVKEIGETVAYKEYETLRNLERLDAPCVEPFAVISGRTSDSGEALNAVLVTKHLPFSLPYRALFGQQAMRSETVDRLIDALTVLMVRLHLLGFFWGDVSLSNTLFRRDAGEFAAYLVDAETGEIEDNLSERKRSYDIDVARTNIIGELMDLKPVVFWMKILMPSQWAIGSNGVIGNSGRSSLAPNLSISPIVGAWTPVSVVSMNSASKWAKSK